MSNEDRNSYCPPNYIDREHKEEFLPGEWRNEQANEGLENITNMGSSNSYTRNAKDVKRQFL